MEVFAKQGDGLWFEGPHVTTEAVCCGAVDVQDTRRYAGDDGDENEPVIETEAELPPDLDGEALNDDDTRNDAHGVG